MKITTIKFMLKEGFANTYKNKLMSLASISVVIASLSIFGVFLLLAMNFNYNTKALSQQPQMQAFCEYELDESRVAEIEKALKDNDKIEKFTKVTSQQALEKFKNTLGEDSDVLEGFDETLLPVSFIINVKEPGQSGLVVEEIKALDGIRKVSYSEEVVNFITRFTKWINMVSGVLIVILLAVSVFIIANTIKLTVFARRREINIMKYIGATDWFIRWPFVIEGVIIGILGAVSAFLLVNYGYALLEARFDAEMPGMGKNFLQMVSIDGIRFQIISYFCLLGTFVGALGSVLSLRKYLRV